MGGTDRDVIVVGGGFAGLQAAHTLAAAGVAVALLEGRERLGGRTWDRHECPSPGERIELGGGFFTPDQHRVVAALERYGMGARPFSAWAHGVEPQWTWRAPASASWTMSAIVSPALSCAS